MSTNPGSVTAPRRRSPGRPFAPGQSGNPRGRPKGSRNKATLAIEAMIAGQVELAGQVIDAALKEGKLQAAGLVVRSLLARPRAAAPSFELPPIDTPADVAAASAAVLTAACNGELSPTEAFAMHRVVEARAHLIGWSPPPPPEPDDSQILFYKHPVDHTPEGATEPLTLFIPAEMLHRGRDGTQIRYQRIDPPTALEIEEALATRRAEAKRRAAYGRPTPPPSLPAPPPAASPNRLPAQAAANADGAAGSATEACIISANTAEPGGPPTGPAPVLDEEVALAKWQRIAADETLPPHKREAAQQEVRRYTHLVECRKMPTPAPVKLTLIEPPEDATVRTAFDRPPTPGPRSPDEEEDWPPPPRLVTVDVPPVWDRQAIHRWLAEEGLRLDGSDELVCRQPTRQPALVSVTPRERALPAVPGSAAAGDAGAR